jgi:hypothetical protein
MRDDFPHSHTGYAVEQEAPGGGAGVGALHLRYQQYADAQDGKDITQS